MKELESTLTERGARYGAFKNQAGFSQDIKKAMKLEEATKLTPSMKEALNMIAHKVGRILAGDPYHDDSWKDIAGYSWLVYEELQKGGSFKGSVEKNSSMGFRP